MKKIFLLLIASCSINLAIGQTTYKNDKIIVFKDGTVYFKKHAVVDVKNKNVVLTPAPFAFLESSDQSRYSRVNNTEKRLIMGTLRFMAPNNSITNVSSFDSSSVGVKLDYSIQSLILANKGHEVSLRLKNKDSFLTGVIVDLDIENGRNYDSALKRIVIKKANSLHYISTSDIEEVRFPKNPIVNENKLTNKTKVISLDLAKNTETQRIDISYLQKGLTWMPNYFLDINDSNNATLSLHANLVNDIEDINDVEVNFVVGIPAFHFSYVSSPMASNKDILQILSDLNNPPKDSKGGIHPTMSQRGPKYNVSYGTNYEAQLEGTNAEDMFFYKKQNVSIRKNASALLPIFNTSITYSDIYTTELNANIKENRLIEANSKEIEVWHAIKFKNTSNFPLTTGSVFFNKKNKNKETALLSQNMIEFTPVNAYSKVKMAITPDIVIQQEEIEKNKEDYDRYYDKYEMEGEITIINYKSKPIEMEVNRIVYGELKKTSQKWKFNTSYGTPLNSKNNVQWKVTIPAGGVEKISYTYQVIAK